MWPLRLSTRVTADANARTLMAALQARQHETQQQQQPSLSEVSSHDVTLDVLLHLHDGCRDTFMAHAHVLYSAVVQVWPLADIAVIPVVDADKNNNSSSGSSGSGNEAKLTATTDGGGGDDEKAVARLTTARMTALPGFRPLYNHVAVGGTFDRLHAGHKLLLSAALLHTTQSLLVGVADDVLLQRKRYRERLQPLLERQARVRAFLQRLRGDSDTLRVTINAITQVAGGADRLAELQALVVSPETERALADINALRRANGDLAPLKPIMVPFVTTDNGHILSSSALREGEVVDAADETTTRTRTTTEQV